MDLFRPSPERAAELDRNVRAHAADSLAIVASGLGRQLPGAELTLGRLVSAMRAGPVRPGTFALYSDLVLAIDSEDTEDVLSVLDSAADFDPVAAEPYRSLSLGDADLGPGMTRRYLRHLNDDPEMAFAAVAPGDEEMAAARKRLVEAVRLIREADPLLEEELRYLAREVVFAADGGGEAEFGSVTSFYVWGAQLVNAPGHRDAPALAEGLVHEAAHALLFGHSLGEPLVENDPAERYASPLRVDPRPLDGIVHAAFVLARLHYLATRPVNLQADRPVAAEYSRQFRSADEIVMRHARFTPVGEALYRAARSYMLQ